MHFCRLSATTLTAREAIMADKPLQHQPRRRGAGRPFEKGKSGNPEGRRTGSRNRITEMVEKLLEGDAERITRAVIDKAADGDMVAARIALDRLAPARRGRPVAFALPRKLETADDLNGAFNAILAAVSRAELSPEEAGSVAAIVEMRRRTLELNELADMRRRLAEMEDSKP